MTNSRRKGNRGQVEAAKKLRTVGARAMSGVDEERLALISQLIAGRLLRLTPHIDGEFTTCDFYADKLAAQGDELVRDALGKLAAANMLDMRVRKLRPGVWSWPGGPVFSTKQEAVDAYMAELAGDKPVKKAAPKRKPAAKKTTATRKPAAKKAPAKES